MQHSHMLCRTQHLVHRETYTRTQRTHTTHTHTNRQHTAHTANHSTTHVHTHTFSEATTSNRQAGYAPQHAQPHIVRHQALRITPTYSTTLALATRSTHNPTLGARHAHRSSVIAHTPHIQQPTAVNIRKISHQHSNLHTKRYKYNRSHKRQ